MTATGSKMAGMVEHDTSPFTTGPPFSARSVVASLLLGLRRPEMPVRALVRSAGLFGISEGTTRVALSRMVAAGEMEADGGVYRLAGPLLERHGRQEEGRHPTLRPWDGSWRLAVVGTGDGARGAAERARVRQQLERLRLAEWREGVWARPDNLTEAAGPSPAPLLGCTLLSGARLGALEDAAALARRLWPLGRWAQTARGLRAAMAEVPPDSDLGGSFRLASAVVRHLRDDPLLPDELLPPGWPGGELRRAYDRYESGFSAALRRQMATI